MDITIQKGGSLPDLKQCTKCCSHFHCPFCDASVFQPTRLEKVQTHLQAHFNRSVSMKEAEEMFLQGPTYHSSEVEEFVRRVAREMKNLPIKNLDDL